MTYPPQQPGPYGPQDPYGQQPHGQQPYGQQPGQPYGQPPQYGAPQWGQQPAYPVGPPPKKSRTGLITTLVVVAVLVIAGGGVAAFLLLKDDGETAAGGDTPREAADAFVKELGTQLSRPVEEVDLAPLKPLTCGDDFGVLNERVTDDREDQSSTTRKPDPPKVTISVADFKETGDGATFSMVLKPEGLDAEEPVDAKVVKESDRWVVCGLFQEKGEQQEAPGQPPTSGGDGDGDGGGVDGSIPNPIPKTTG